MIDIAKPAFIPMLYIKHEEGIAALEFYKKAFGATIFRQFDNDDGTVHIAELLMGGALFRFHEEKPSAQQSSPHTCGTTTVGIHLMLNDLDEVMEKAIAAGAKMLSPMQDYFYGYRQGEMVDPFGHFWTLETVIDAQ
jgi:PhnB protein